MAPYKVTKPIVKLVAFRGEYPGFYRMSLDPDDLEGIESAKEEFDRFHRVSFWLQCDDAAVEGHSLYTLNSNPREFSIDNRGFYDLERAIEYFKHDIT